VGGTQGQSPSGGKSKVRALSTTDVFACFHWCVYAGIPLAATIALIVECLFFFALVAGADSAQNKDRQTLIPLTIKQLKGASQEHQDDAWKVDGAELHNVKLVGCVLNVDEQSTFTKFDIEDSTGVIEVKLWDSGGDDHVMVERRAACR